MNWYKKAQESFPSVLTSNEMEDFILNNNFRNWSGELDYNDAHEIANHVKQWVLTELPLSLFNWTADPKYRNRSRKFPPIVLKDENGYEVLDGKHRIGMAKEKGLKSIQVYLGEWKDELV
jgi:hypothetical protein